MSRKLRLLVPSWLGMHHMLQTSGAVKLCSHEVLRERLPEAPCQLSAARSIRLIPGTWLLVSSCLGMHHILLNSGGDKFCSHEVLRRASAGGARPAQRSSAAARGTCLMPWTLVAGVLLARNASYATE